MSGATVTGIHLGPDIHASRPAANAAGQPIGALYSCTTHGLIYKTDGSSWSTYATLGGSPSGSITASGYTQSTAKLLGRTTASTGAIEEISVGSGLSLSAGSLTATGGAGTRAFGLDRASFHATYGDDFDGASLNARWSRHVQASGEETYQVGGLATALRVTYSNAAAARYIYQTAPNGTNETWECCLANWEMNQTGQMFGLLMVDSSGNGVAATVYDNAPGYYLVNVTGHLETSALASSTAASMVTREGERLYLRLRKASGVYSASFSLNGETYSPEVTGTPSAFTPARVGVGRILGTAASPGVVDWFWFDKTA